MVVRFMINESGKVVEKTFNSPYLAENFIRKLKYSKKLTFLAKINL